MKGFPYRNIFISRRKGVVPGTGPVIFLSRDPGHLLAGTKRPVSCLGSGGIQYLNIFPQQLTHTKKKCLIQEWKFDANPVMIAIVFRGASCTMSEFPWGINRPSRWSTSRVIPRPAPESRQGAANDTCWPDQSITRNDRRAARLLLGEETISGIALSALWNM